MTKSKPVFVHILTASTKSALPEPRHREIPVCYGGEFGPDLADVCDTHSLSVEQAIDLHVSATYIVYFLGFVPGFAYLGGLPEALVTPRLPVPRRRVPPGSVGIAGHQSGVYPFATPGGWRLIGRTPLAMFRPDRDRHELLVHWRPSAFHTDLSRAIRRFREHMKTIQVQAPGLFTTVQDLGREGFGPLGVSPSGAADPISLRLGNRLVGNPESAAALEMTLLGGAFVFPEGAVLALSGSDFGATLDNVPVDPWMSFEARPGQTLRLGPTRSGARSYLCVQGGIAVKAFSRQRLDARAERPRRVRRQTTAQGRCAEHRERISVLPQANA